MINLAKYISTNIRKKFINANKISKMLISFGKNIKKIRSVHGLSQQAFADIFDLKRAALGAYEEGRSNPKLETVLKIANHFSIGIEELLTGELTVNRLLKFNERITTESEKLAKQEFEPIPCLLYKEKEHFAKNFVSGFDLNELPVIRIPNVESTNRLAFSVDDLSMTGGGIEFFPKDLIIGAETEIKNIQEGKLIIALINEEFVFRRLYFQGKKFVLKADHHGVEDLIISIDKITAIWIVEHVIHYAIHTKEIHFTNRLTHLEQSIASLQNKKTT